MKGNHPQLTAELPGDHAATYWNIRYLILDNMCGQFRRSRKSNNPSVEFELIANPLGAHIETHRKLILITLSYTTENSQDDSHSELAVSFP